LSTPPLSHSRRVAHDRRSRGHVLRHYGTRSDNGVRADCHAAHDSRAAANAGAVSYQRGNCLPIVIGLQAAVCGGGAGNFIVDEGNPVTNEDFIFNLDAFTDERMAGDFAATADAGAFLNLDEGTDSGFVSDFAAVEIYKVMNNDVAAQSDIGRNYTKLSGHYGV